MKPDPPFEDKKREPNPWGQAGLAMSLPSLMVAGPLVGYLLGVAITRWFSIESPWSGRIRVIGLLLGLASGARETIRVIKRISQDSKD